MVLDGLESSRVQGGGVASEAGLGVDEVSVTLEQAHGAGDGGRGNSTLELDNVLVGNEVGIAGLDERSGTAGTLADLGRGSECQRQQRQNSGSLHFEISSDELAIDVLAVKRSV